MKGILERSGLSLRELDMLLTTLQGLPLIQPGRPEDKIYGLIYDRNALAGIIADEAREAHIDMRGYGTWLATRNGDPEAPFSLHDLREKIMKMSDDQANLLFFYAEGYSDGRSGEDAWQEAEKSGF